MQEKSVLDHTIQDGRCSVLTASPPRAPADAARVRGGAEPAPCAAALPSQPEQAAPVGAPQPGAAAPYVPPPSVVRGVPLASARRAAVRSSALPAARGAALPQG